MAQITIFLPDDLHESALRIGVDVDRLCQRAVAAEIDGLRSLPGGPPRPAGEAVTGRTSDDRQRFQRGVELGLGWARTARPAEIEEIAAWGGLRWRQFRVDPATHSLPAAYCRDNHLDDPPVGESFWFERDAYTVGMVQGVVMAHSRMASPGPRLA